MRRKSLIVACLLPAYLLLVLHAIIPHHHHFSGPDGPISFHHGFDTHEHKELTKDHSHDHEDHGHTAHFVHSPEFGHAMVRPDAKWMDTTFPNNLSGILETNCSTDRNISHDAVGVFCPESPPHYSSPAASALTLRGPPSITLT